MSNILLFHHSDTLFESLKPPTDKKPLFYWYADRWCSIFQPLQYLYIFAFNPKQDGIALRSRTDDQGFSDLHKQYLSYRNYCEGIDREHNWSETGIVMSFDRLRPVVALKHVNGGEYKVISPRKIIHKAKVNFLSEDDQPIPFAQITELAQLIPRLNDTLPFKVINPNSKGEYEYDDWVPMVTEKMGSWL